MVPISFSSCPHETGAVVLMENKVPALRWSPGALDSTGGDGPCCQRGWIGKKTFRADISIKKNIYGKKIIKIKAQFNFKDLNVLGD